MSKTLTLSPVTRIEGHLAVKVEVEADRVISAQVAGEMFRGFEQILRGRDPLDAQHITQRICGVCPIEHGMASVLAQEMAYRVAVPDNGRLVRNLIQAANFIMSDLTHFYLLSALDFVDVTVVADYQGQDAALRELGVWVKAQLASKSVLPAAPFLPRLTAEYLRDKDTNLLALKHYLEALEMRALAHKMGAIFAGKMPHAATLIPGGVTEKVTALKVAEFREFLERLREFIATAYLPDTLAVASAFPAYFEVGRSPGNYLSYGVFPESADVKSTWLPGGALVGGKLQPVDVKGITEDVGQSWLSSPSGKHPEAGATVPAPDKAGAYSWLKAPRYQGQVMEVGPLARLLVACEAQPNGPVKLAVSEFLKAVGKEPKDLNSVMGRHAARALECHLLAAQCESWLDQLVPEAPTYGDYTVPDAGAGYGLTEAARGALGHWITVAGGVVGNYQCVVPTTWNCSPRDDRGTPGCLEQALVGTPVADPESLVEVARVIRSFDPCLACAVH